MPGKLHFTATIHPRKPEDAPLLLDVLGREAGALRELIKAGTAGCTPIDNPAPRWSHYAWLLRGHGVHVETIDEPHADPFAGSHARYVLRDQVTGKGGNLAEWEGVNLIQTRAAA